MSGGAPLVGPIDGAATGMGRPWQSKPDVPGGLPPSRTKKPQSRCAIGGLQAGGKTTLPRSSRTRVSLCQNISIRREGQQAGIPGHGGGVGSFATLSANTVPAWLACLLRAWSCPFYPETGSGGILEPEYPGC